MEGTIIPVITLKRRRDSMEHFARDGIPPSVLKEISTLKLLNHTNIIKIQKISPHFGNLHIIYSTVHCRSLYDLFMSGKTIDISIKVFPFHVWIIRLRVCMKEAVRQLFGALDYCHSNGIVHRLFNRITNCLFEIENKSNISVQCFFDAW